MTPKNTKNQHSAKNSYRKRQKTNIIDYSENNRIEGNGSGEKLWKPVKSIYQARKAPPKPPQNGYFIWGRHTVFAALANPERRLQNIYVTPDSADELETALHKLESYRQRDIPSPQITERSRLDGVGGAKENAVHQGIVAAVWPLDSPSLDAFLDTLPKETSRVNIRLLILDQLSDPRNVGAIMRSARAFGVAGIITTFRNAAEENGALAKAASGALDHVPLIRIVNLARGMERLQDNGFTVAGLAGDADKDVSSLSFHKRLAIVLGAEGSGLRRLSREHCNLLVRINIDNNAESLNVSNASAIALYAASVDFQT
ncbi:RNA methyltransferase [Candidatus Puniceispirillum sp.]|nr:RNA methyltransferase [Candidatus Puniceispirillum sp.]